MQDYSQLFRPQLKISKTQLRFFFKSIFNSNVSETLRIVFRMQLI